MKRSRFLRKARLLVIPAVIAGMIAAQVNANDCLDKDKCYKLTYHPT